MSVANAGEIAAADSILAGDQKGLNTNANVEAPSTTNNTYSNNHGHSHSHSHSHIAKGDFGSSGNEEVLYDDPDEPENSQPTAPDQFDPALESTKWEIWAYYAYYIGNNGLTLFNFAPTLFQDLLYIAAGDAETLPFLGRFRTIESIVLQANGISFAIQVVLFLILGSYADFGTWRRWILIFWTMVAFGLGFGWMGVHDPAQWRTGTGLYMVGLISYQMCVTFWTAAFPGLARNTPEMRIKAEEYETGKVTRDEYDFADMMQRNRISNVSLIAQSAGEIVILAVLVGILFALDVTASEENNLYGLSVLIAYATGCWVLLAAPWFFLEKKRPGQVVPAGMTVIGAGLWNLWQAMKSVWKLKQSLLYLIGYFLLGDSLNTTVTVVGTLQNSVLAYDSLKITYLLIVGIATQLAGIFTFWHVQKYFRLSTKTMFDVVMLAILLLDLWGMVGIFTSKFGFHNAWEFWLYQAYYGFFVCPWYSYSQIMISEVTPRGKEFLFFSLFSIMGKTSAFIGPIVSSAIIDADTDAAAGKPGNQSLPFYFLAGLTAISFLILFFGVDLKKSRQEQAIFLEAEKRERQRRASVVIGVSRDDDDDYNDAAGTASGAATMGNAHGSGSDKLGRDKLG